LKPSQRHSAQTRQEVLKASQERMSLRGIERVFNVCRQTVVKWIQQHVWQLPVLSDTLVLYEVGDVLEIDELWSFVEGKNHKRWIWVALCRRTRQIVAYYIGKRDALAAQQLWQRIEYPYYVQCIPNNIKPIMERYPNTCIGRKKRRAVQHHTSNAGITRSDNV